MGCFLNNVCNFYKIKKGNVVPTFYRKREKKNYQF